MSGPGAKGADANAAQGNKIALRRMTPKRKRLVCDEDDEDEPVQFAEAMKQSAWKGGFCVQESPAGDVDAPKNASSIEDELPVAVVPDDDGMPRARAKWRPYEGHVPLLPDAPAFYPDKDEFSDPIKYISSIRQDAEPYGICRIVPPRSWRPPCALEDEARSGTVKFTVRKQKIHKLQKRMQQCSSDSSSSSPVPFGFQAGPAMSLPEFRAYAEAFMKSYFTTDEQLTATTVEDFEGEYWRIVECPTEQVEVIYGADLDTAKVGTGFPKPKPEPVQNGAYEKSGWNLNNFARAPGSMLCFEDAEISGVVVPWVYIGMSLSSFCWHVEDHFLYSINYLHFGGEKVWYGVPRGSATMLEDTMKRHLPDLFMDQPDLLQKLVTQFSPSILKDENVPVYRAVQRPGDFVVTFPRAYHCGFSTGFNCAEAVNFAPMDWLVHGQAAVELYQKFRRKTTVSHDKLLFAAVKACIDAAKTDGVRAPFWRQTLDDVDRLSTLMKACKARIQTEHSRRTWRDDIKSRKMDADFDHTEERECLHCHYDLHLSAVSCDCSPGRFACLEHVDLLCKCPKESKYALYRYDLSELYGFQTALEKLLKDITEKGECLVDASGGGSVMSVPSKHIASVASARCNKDSGSSSEKKAMDSKVKTTPGKDCPLVVLSDDDDYETNFVKKEVEDEKNVLEEPVEIATPALKLELLDVGTLSAAGWCSKASIFPPGFKSRVLYYNFLNLSQPSHYVSEIVDCGAEEPYFKVSLENSPHTFVDVSADLCWRAIQRRLNFEIHSKRKLGNFNVPRERPVEEISGIAMFGLSDPAIKKVVEALDKRHVCRAYWEKTFSTELDSLALLRNLFLKGDKDELWALHKVLGAEWGKDMWKQCFQALADVLEGLLESSVRK
ncbi:putative lysine-specific demethylase JMJ16 [Selaginella moellendorffii]|uniref:putative lysine-specific demethylase JMJ16 n=1 Tax=Selaginella moellendorffii TaxID=88036 RepID=UPI000D1D1073|nr:putative lysine-specific demethylase JMJ16 [Selaginella moellendorffii]|eukprot:XP_024533629.1 putative lysine-specific demethylase JMJ16 [Selaginella moellendorffii]